MKKARRQKKTGAYIHTNYARIVIMINQCHIGIVHLAFTFQAGCCCGECGKRYNGKGDWIGCDGTCGS